MFGDAKDARIRRLEVRIGALEQIIHTKADKMVKVRSTDMSIAELEAAADRAKEKLKAAINSARADSSSFIPGEHTCVYENILKETGLMAQAEYDKRADSGPLERLIYKKPDRGINLKPEGYRPEQDQIVSMPAPARPKTNAEAQETAHLIPSHYQNHQDNQPIRNDTRAIIELGALARRLIDPDDLGHAVTQEVRDLARKALGIKE